MNALIERAQTLSERRLSRLSIVGGSFTLLVGGVGAYFLARIALAPAPWWVLAVGVPGLVANVAAGAWMIRRGIRGPTGASEFWSRHATAGAVASIFWAPLELAGPSTEGFPAWFVGFLAFAVTEIAILRWVDSGVKTDVETGAGDELIDS